MKVINREWIASVWAAVAAGQSIVWADFEWYGVDRDGSIGFFTTAGPGPVPRAVFEDMEAYLDVLGFFAGVNSWQNAAERGLYGFDYAFRRFLRRDGYRIMARPTEPLHISGVPDWLGDWLTPMTFDRIAFARCGRGRIDLNGTGMQWVTDAKA